MRTDGRDRLTIAPSAVRREPSRGNSTWSSTSRSIDPEPRRFPDAAGLPRPAAGSGATRGLALSPWSVFPHECCRYPELTGRALQRRGQPGRGPGPGVALRHALYSLARVSAVLGMRRQDHFGQGSRGWLKAPREGREAARRRGPSPGRCRPSTPTSRRQARGAEGGALPEHGPGGAPVDGPGARAAGRPGDDQAARRGCGAPALEHAQQIAGHASPEDDEALRPDGGPGDGLGGRSCALGEPASAVPRLPEARHGGRSLSQRRSTRWPISSGAGARLLRTRWWYARTRRRP